MRYVKKTYRRRPYRRTTHTYKRNAYSYLYFDTFQMELLLDRLHEAVNVMEGINHLNRNIFSSPQKNGAVDTLRDSLDTINSIIPQDSSKNQLANISNALGMLSKMGGIQGMVQSMAPMLKALASTDNDFSLK